MISKLNFGIVKFFDNYAICEINDGETISIERNRALIELALDYYKGDAFTFIVDRKHSYSVDPMIYREISKIDTLLGIAVSSNKKRVIESCQIEKLFSTKPFELFLNLKDAILWANKNTESYYLNNSSSSIAS